MGKRAKEHRKKVAARNQRIKGEMKKAEKVAMELIERGRQLTDQSKYSNPLSFNPAVQSAVDVHRLEKNKIQTN